MVAPDSYPVPAGMDEDSVRGDAMSYDEEKAGLLKKVRELEAELADARTILPEEYAKGSRLSLAMRRREEAWQWQEHRLIARAEKAEKERDDWKECAESMQQERDSVKALVAELEKEIQECRETPVIGDYSETHEARE